MPVIPCRSQYIFNLLSLTLSLFSLYLFSFSLSLTTFLYFLRTPTRCALRCCMCSICQGLPLGALCMNNGYLFCLPEKLKIFPSFSSLFRIYIFSAIKMLFKWPNWCLYWTFFICCFDAKIYLNPYSLKCKAIINVVSPD